MKKIGFDIHGVIDSNPKYFSVIMRQYREQGHEVHVITGSKDTPEIRAQLAGWGVEFDHFFSIGDWCKANSDSYYEDERGRPYDDNDVWDKVKAIYCEEVGIDIHIDDSHDYYMSFTYIPTVYFLMDKSQGFNPMDACSAINDVIKDECDNYPCNKNCPQYTLYKKRAYEIVAKSDLSVSASERLSDIAHNYTRMGGKVDLSQVRKDLKVMVDKLVEDIFMEFG